MSHLYEKYTNLGQDHSLKCFDILKGLHVLGIIGFHRSGKKTLIKNISKHYNKLVFIIALGQSMLPLRMGNPGY